MEELLSQLPGDPVANAAAVGAFGLAVLDFLIGTVRAIANRTWSAEYAATWVRLQLLGQVTPIVLALLFGQVIGDITIGDVSFNVITASALLAAGTYAVTTINSIKNSLTPSAPDPVPQKAT